MNSCLYECQVVHARFSPRAHRFAYRVFYLAVDLDELASLDRLPLLSVNRWNVFSVREDDYLPTHEPVHNPAGQPDARPAPAGRPGSLKARVTDYLAARGVDLEGGRVVLVTMPRVLGYGFNPVSFYFCHDRHGTPVAAIAEVTNTFREMKPYFLAPAEAVASPAASAESPPAGPAPESPTAFRLRTPKYFYVSPYSGLDVAFDFHLRLPGERLSVEIDDYTGQDRTLATALAGRRQGLTNARLAWFSLKYPLVTVQVIALIHWQALRLWLKKVPWFAKAARPADQRELYRPHRSLLHPADSA